MSWFWTRYRSRIDQGVNHREAAAATNIAHTPKYIDTTTTVRLRNASGS